MALTFGAIETPQHLLLAMQDNPGLTLNQRLEFIVDMGQIISFQGNAIAEELAKTLTSKEIEPATLQNLPGTLQRRIEEVRKQINPTEVRGGVEVYSDRLVFEHIHRGASLRYLIDTLFLAWPRDLLTTFESDESNPDQVAKYLGTDHAVTLLDEPEANALVVTSFLRDHPDNFTSFVKFKNPDGYHWRRWTWDKLGCYGLPASALEPFCSAVTNAYDQELIHNDFLFPILLLRVQKDYPDFVLKGKVPDICLENMKDETYTKMHY